MPILGPDSVTSARLSLEASKAGRFGKFHDALWAAGRPSPETNAIAAKAAGISAEPTDDMAVVAEIRRNMQLAGQLGATGTPLFVIGDRVMNGAVGYDTSQAGDRGRSLQEELSWLSGRAPGPAAAAEEPAESLERSQARRPPREPVEEEAAPSFRAPQELG